MKALTLALILSLPVPRLAPAPKPVIAAAHETAKPKGGRWYMAASGHAVYCYGPVMTMLQGKEGLHRVATFCRGDQPMVPLKE
jgi:hypothetical protein